MAWSEEPNATNLFDKIGKYIGDMFNGKNYADMNDNTQRQIEENKRKLQAAQAQPGYRAPLGESGSVVSELITGRRNNESAPSTPDTSWLTNARKAAAAPEYDFNFDGMDSEPDTSNTDAIWDRLAQNFDFEGTRAGVDTKAFDDALAARMAIIEQAKGNANSGFAESDANLKAMHDAFQNDTRAQAPTIQASYDSAGANLKEIFGDTIQENNDQQTRQTAERTEMLQRLGLAPSANAPDIAAEQTATSNAAAQQSRDARLVENNTMGQIAQDRNNNFASAVGSEGVARRSNLNQQLQEILTNLDRSGADYQNDAINAKMGYQDKQTDQSYERWLQDRSFDFNQLQEQNQYNIGMEQARGESAAAMAKAGESTVSGFDGLWGQTPDSVKKAVMNVSQKVNIEADPQKALRTIAKMAEKDPSINMDEVFQYFNKRDTLGTSNKFPIQ